MDENFYLIGLSMHFVLGNDLDVDPRKKIPQQRFLNVYHSCVDFKLVDFIQEIKESLEAKKGIKVLDVVVLSRIAVTEKEYKINVGETKDG